MNGSARDQILKACLLAWLILSGIGLMVVAAPLCLDESTIVRYAPACEWKTQDGRECFLCGGTRAFVFISRGQFAQAWRANRASLPLFAALSLNAMAAMAYVTIGARKSRESSSFNLR